MEHVTPDGIEREMQKPPVNLWHWILPIIISLAVTGSSVVFFTGASAQRLQNVEDKIKTLESSTATRSQVDDLKDDVKELKTDVKELIKQKR